MNPLHKKFHMIRAIPRATLSNDIVAHVAHRKKILGRRIFLTYSIIGILSLLLAIPAIALLAREISQSGFFQYVSLAFSSGSSVGGSDIASAIVSSIPATGIILVLAALGTFAWSFRKAFVLPVSAIA